MRRNSLNQISRRGLIGFALLTLIAVGGGAFGFSVAPAEHACMHCPDNSDCRGLAACNTTASTPCCEWGLQTLLPASEIKTPPKRRLQDQPTAFVRHDTLLSRDLANSYRAQFFLATTHSAGAGTETYLATARLRI